MTFQLSDIPTILVLIFLELLLSSDNALVLAVLTHRLKEAQRKKALFIGLGSAIILRAIGIFAASFLLEMFWIQILGALYLFYLSIRYFYQKKKSPLDVKEQSFWKTVIAIELTDLAFALDSILAAVAFISTYAVPGELNPKIWIVYVAAIIGIVGVRYCASFISKLLENFPRLPMAAHLIVGWIGCKLLFDGLVMTFSLPHFLKEAVLPVFWVILLILFGIGLTKKKKPLRIDDHGKEKK